MLSKFDSTKEYNVWLRVVSFVIGSLFHSFSFGQYSLQFRMGAPFNMNSGLTNYLSETYGLEKNMAFAFNGGIDYYLKGGYYIFGQIQVNDYFFSQDTLALKLPQVNSIGGVGKEFDLGDKFRVGVQVDIGACMSTQHWFTTSEEINYFQSLNKSNQSITSIGVTDARIKFYLGTDVFISYKIGRSIRVFMGIKNSILPMKQLDRIGDQPLYGFYLCPYVGLRDLHFHRKREIED